MLAGAERSLGRHDGHIITSLIQPARANQPLGRFMSHSLFFSWQSDTSAAIGLEFIEEALGLAIAALAEDAENREGNPRRRSNG
jgi:hypothetical protein